MICAANADPQRKGLGSHMGTATHSLPLSSSATPQGVLLPAGRPISFNTEAAPAEEKKVRQRATPVKNANRIEPGRCVVVLPVRCRDRDSRIVSVSIW